MEGRIRVKVTVVVDGDLFGAMKKYRVQPTAIACAAFGREVRRRQAMIELRKLRRIDPRVRGTESTRAEDSNTSETWPMP